MTDLQCLICDYVVPAGSSEDEVLALLGSTSPAAGALLVEHMSQHDLADWVRAFKMADAYIAQLEEQLEAAKQSASELVRVPQPVFQPPTPHLAVGKGALADLTPAEQARMNRQAQVQALVQAADPDQTLIPRIPDAQRPEGVVGVKY